jgi:hypothetical protein
MIHAASEETTGRRVAKAVLAAWTVLVASFVLLCPDLAAREKRGLKLEVTFREGRQASRQVVGELVAVRTESLLLVQEYSELDLSIAIADITRIKVIKKSIARKWGTYMSLIGLCGGVLRGYSLRDDTEQLWPLASIYLGAGFAIGGFVVGAFAGHLASKGETFEFEGRSELEIKGMLDRLRNMARVSEYR